MINFALDNGYRAKNVVVHGMSLGGAIATKALALEVDKYKKIKKRFWFSNQKTVKFDIVMRYNFNLLCFKSIDQV